jgi:hypothetical protein
MRRAQRGLDGDEHGGKIGIHGELSFGSTAGQVATSRAEPRRIQNRKRAKRGRTAECDVRRGERARRKLGRASSRCARDGFIPVQSVLAEVRLPRGRHVAALVSFNVGIELAQLAFVTVMLVPLAWLARRSFYRGLVLQGGSAAVALCGALWLWERLAA